MGQGGNQAQALKPELLTGSVGLLAPPLQVQNSRTVIKAPAGLAKTSLSSHPAKPERYKMTPDFPLGAPPGTCCLPCHVCLWAYPQALFTKGFQAPFRIRGCYRNSR